MLSRKGRAELVAIQSRTFALLREISRLEDRACEILNARSRVERDTVTDFINGHLLVNETVRAVRVQQALRQEQSPRPTTED